jgi:excisionase family DNA binding protein
VEQLAEQYRQERMMTARQVADFLGVSVQSIRRWSFGGGLRFYRVGAAGLLRYRRDDVLDFLEASSSRSESGPGG